MYVHRLYIRLAAGAALVVSLCFTLMAFLQGLSAHNILALTAFLGVLFSALGLAYVARRTPLSVIGAYVGSILATIATVIYLRG